MGTKCFKIPGLSKKTWATAKREMNPALYEELTFSRKRKIAQTVLDHNIHNDMILNFDQTPLGFTAPNKTTYTEGGGGDNRYQLRTWTINVKSLPLSMYFYIWRIFAYPADLWRGKWSMPSEGKVSGFISRYSINQSLVQWEPCNKILSQDYISVPRSKKRQKLNFKDDTKASSRVHQPVFWMNCCIETTAL